MGYSGFCWISLDDTPLNDVLGISAEPTQSSSVPGFAILFFNYLRSPVLLGLGRFCRHNAGAIFDLATTLFDQPRQLRRSPHTQDSLLHGAT